jgi:hypothetical protein
MMVLMMIKTRMMLLMMMLTTMMILMVMMTRTAGLLVASVGPSCARLKQKLCAEMCACAKVPVCAQCVRERRSSFSIKAQLCARDSPDPKSWKLACHQGHLRGRHNIK